MSAENPRRLLRPRHVFHSLGHIWVVDETQPVAALFDPNAGNFVRLVSWTDLPAPQIGQRQPTIVVDAGGLWVQNPPDGPLARIGLDGVVRAEFTEGKTLIGAGAAGAWCHKFRKRTPDVTDSLNATPRPFRPSTLLMALPDGGIHNVSVVDAHVVSIEADDESLFVGVEHFPWTRKPTAADPGGRVRYEAVFASSVLRVPLGGPVPDVIEPGVNRVENRKPGYTSEYADQYYNESHYRKRAFDDEFRWNWGTVRTKDRTTLIRGYRNDVLVTTIDTSRFRIADGAAAAEQLWIIGREHDTRPIERTFSVVDTNGEIRPIDATGIDITDRCRPPGPTPLDHESYIAYCVRRLDGMLFSHNTSNLSASYVGEWPHGQLHVSFEHLDYPGLTLLARCDVYDERGQRLDDATSYISGQLGEQASEGRYPPAADAIDGVLWV